MKNVPASIALLISTCLSVAAPLARTEGATPIWTDPATRLTWTAADNGSGISGIQAIGFCRQLRIGGYADWSLPSIDQLQTLVSPAANPSGHHIRGPLHLTGWQWSRTPGVNKGEQWTLDLGDGARASVMTGDSGLNRALCVR